ncbi:MAG: nitrous oxide-stimulated promoter family protein [bacterium]
MSGEFFRKKRDNKTIEAMIKIYCQGRHRTGVKLCPECEELLRYAMKRIVRCPLKESKTTCAKCPVHCYTPIMRQRIRDVMCFSGPRMMYRHPVLTLFHLFDGLKPKIKRAALKKNME